MKKEHILWCIITIVLTPTLCALVSIGVYRSYKSTPSAPVEIIEKPVNEESRAAIKYRWVNSFSDGHPHRMTLLNDDTEILTIGNHTQPNFVLLIRYKDEARFRILGPCDDQDKIKFISELKDTQ